MKCSEWTLRWSMNHFDFNCCTHFVPKIASISTTWHSILYILCQYFALAVWKGSMFQDGQNWLKWAFYLSIWKSKCDFMRIWRYNTMGWSGKVGGKLEGSNSLRENTLILMFVMRQYGNMCTSLLLLNSLKYIEASFWVYTLSINF